MTRKTKALLDSAGGAISHALRDLSRAIEASEQEHRSRDQGLASNELADMRTLHEALKKLCQEYAHLGLDCEE